MGTTKIETPQLVRAETRLLGLDLRTADRVVGASFMAGNIAVFSNGGLSSNGFEVATGILWFSNSAALMIWPGKTVTIKYLGTTTALGAASFICAALNKDHPWGQIISGSVTCIRGIVLLADQSRHSSNSAIKFYRQHRKEIFAYSGMITRLVLLTGAIRNREPALVLAALSFFNADIFMLISSQLEKRKNLFLLNSKQKQL